MTDFLLAPVCAVTAQDTLPNAALWIKGGVIAGCFAENELPAEIAHLPRVDGKGCFAVPGFIDLHIHGYAGFGPELADPQALLNMSAALLQSGVTAFCPTLYCAKPNEMETLLKKLVPAIGKESGAQIIGFHLEGPFISPKKPGVMKPQDIAPADLPAFQRLFDAAEGHIAAVTQAMKGNGKKRAVPPVYTFIRSQHIQSLFIQSMHAEKTHHSTDRIIAPLVQTRQCRQISAMRHPQGSARLFFQPACHSGMIRMRMGHDLFDKTVCPQTVFPDLYAGCTGRTGIDRTPAIAIFQQPDIDVVEDIRQRHPQPYDIGCDDKRGFRGNCPVEGIDDFRHGLKGNFPKKAL